MHVAKFGLVLRQLVLALLLMQWVSALQVLLTLKTVLLTIANQATPFLSLAPGNVLLATHVAKYSLAPAQPALLQPQTSWVIAQPILLMPATAISKVVRYTKQGKFKTATRQLAGLLYIGIAK